MENNIKSITTALVTRYNTRDPFRLAEDLDFILIKYPLLSTRGFLQVYAGSTIIYINSDLDSHQQRLVCAHEIAHHFLHRGLNRIFLDRNTYFLPGKIEREANLFALELLYSDEDLSPYVSLPLENAANFMGVSTPLAATRMQSVSPAVPRAELENRVNDLISTYGASHISLAIPNKPRYTPAETEEILAAVQTACQVIASSKR